MKRIAALLLAGLMALTALSALAESYTIEQKFYQQAFVESAYRGTVTFAVEGNGSAAIDSGTWTLLKALAPRLKLEVNHTASRVGGEGQASATLLLDENENAKATLMYDEKLVAVSSTLLGGENTYYTAARDWDWTRLLQSLIQGENEWPPVWRMILAVYSASEEWKAKAQPKLELYETKLELWMNGYASYSIGKDGNTSYTQIAFTIPGSAVKQEIKQLLLDFYSDSELLTMLREVVSAQEAAAYLQPAMRDSLFTMIDELKLEGNVELVRRYDAKGNSVLDQIEMPFAEGGLIQSLTISAAAQEDGKRYEIQGTAQKGASFSLQCVDAGDGIYTGEVDILMPEEETDSFIVDDGTVDQKRVSFSFSLSWDPGEEEYTLASDRFTRTMRGSLLLRPLAEDAFPVQAISLELNFSSGSSQRSSTQLNGTLTWRDMDADSAITATLESKTVSPFAYTAPSSLNGAVRLDLMTQDSRSALLQSWLNKISTFTTLLTQASGLDSLVPLATVSPKK